MMLILSLSPSSFPTTERYGIDINGKPISDLAGPGVRVVVLVFAASDCPISNRYIPEIARLSNEFSPQGVRFWWVFPNSADTAQIISQHNRDFGIHEDAVLDFNQTMVRRANVTTTPEVAVFTSGMREVYHGRIDDRYVSLGHERPQPQHRDLEMAITAALSGKPVPLPGGPPVGCSIVFLQK
jgi:hypothetical protein